jgi:uncharacterized protein
MPLSGGGSPRFIADAMLGSLARKMRALGFDTSYYRSGGDSGLIQAATSEGRVVLTSDRALAVRCSAKGVAVAFLNQRTDGARLSSIACQCIEMGVPFIRGTPLCSLCGGGLETLRKAQVSGRVPPSVLKSHRLFFRCASCGHLYWRGSHWKKLRSLARRLDQNPVASHDVRRKAVSAPRP